jgi:DNA-binding MurR/RpiR family transcriptional regulator
MTTKNRTNAGEPSEQVLKRMIDQFDSLSPQLSKAARYLIDHPNEVALIPMRELAASAGVKPSTLVRVATAMGYESFSAMRLPFREKLRVVTNYIPERARRLESEGDNTQRLYTEMVDSVTANLSDLFASVDAKQLRETADAIVAANRVIITGVGSCYALANYFYYVARMALHNVVLTPQQGSLPIDDLTDVGAGDILVAFTFRPYRQETIDAAQIAKSHKAKVIAITDSRTAPVAFNSHTVFLIPTETPQFFPAVSSALALLECLLAFIVARGGRKAVRNIEAFDRMRHDFSVWWPNS